MRDDVFNGDGMSTEGDSHVDCPRVEVDFEAKEECTEAIASNDIGEKEKEFINQDEVKPVGRAKQPTRYAKFGG